MVLRLLAVLAPFALRELVHWRIARKSPRKRDGTSSGGEASVLLWTAAYITLLAHAARAVWLDAVWLSGWIGLPILWAGAVLRSLAYRALGSHYAATIRVHADHMIVRSGPYRWLRHPLHLGLVLEMAGLALVAPSVLALSLLAVAIGVLVVRNFAEERVLLAGLGERYGAYRASTWDPIDWLPFGGRR